MKFKKKMLSILLSVALLLQFGLPTLASNTTLTIENAEVTDIATAEDPLEGSFTCSGKNYDGTNEVNIKLNLSDGSITTAIGLLPCAIPDDFMEYTTVKIKPNSIIPIDDKTIKEPSGDISLTNVAYIMPKNIDLIIKAEDKVYDGTLTAVITAMSIDPKDVISGEIAPIINPATDISSAYFIDFNVGEQTNIMFFEEYATVWEDTFWTRYSYNSHSAPLSTSAKITPAPLKTFIISATASSGDNDKINPGVRLTAKIDNLEVSSEYIPEQIEEIKNNVTWQWYADETPILNANNATYIVNETDRNKTLHCEANIVGNVAGTATSNSFTVPDLPPKKTMTEENTTVDGLAESYIYTGSPIKPTITIKDGLCDLENGKDYELNYGENTNVGKGTVTIAFKGEYIGSFTKEFNIIKNTPPVDPPVVDPVDPPVVDPVDPPVVDPVDPPVVDPVDPPVVDPVDPPVVDPVDPPVVDPVDPPVVDPVDPPVVDPVDPPVVDPVDPPVVDPVDPPVVDPVDPPVVDPVDPPVVEPVDPPHIIAPPVLPPIVSGGTTGSGTTTPSTEPVVTAPPADSTNAATEVKYDEVKTSAPEVKGEITTATAKILLDETITDTATQTKPVEIKAELSTTDVATTIESAKTKSVLVNIVLPNAVATNANVKIQELIASKEILQVAATSGKDISFGVKTANGTQLFSMSFKGSELKGRALKDVNLAMNVLEPSAKIAKVLPTSAVLSFQNDGLFPAPCTVTANVSNLFKDGVVLNLYYDNVKKGTLDLVKQGITVTFGVAQDTINHASDYVLSEALINTTSKPSINPATGVASTGVALLGQLF